MLSDSGFGLFTFTFFTCERAGTKKAIQKHKCIFYSGSFVNDEGSEGMVPGRKAKSSGNVEQKEDEMKETNKKRFKAMWFPIVSGREKI